MHVRVEMFLVRMDLYNGESKPSEVLDAVRGATPQSGARFEAEYGPIEMGAQIVAGGDEGGWVRVYKLLEDGTVETTFHEGGSPEAERI